MSPSCDCGGHLVEVLNYHAGRLDDHDLDQIRVYKCSSCGRFTDSKTEDHGQGDLFREATE